MTISYQGKGCFTVKSRLATIKLGSKVKIGELVLPGSGEYEASGIEIEGLPDGIFLIRCEDIFLLYLDRLNRDLTDKELDLVNLTDILFIPVGGNETDVPKLSVLNAEQAMKVVNQVDPRVVIPMYFSSIEPFRKTEGKLLEIMKELKITKSSLPEEDRQVVVLGDR